jgi:hypothetical protein
MPSGCQIGILIRMATCFFPLQYMIAAFALWLDRQQQEVIDYLKEENRLRKEKLGDRKLHFSDAERRRLALRAKVLGRKILAQLDTLVTPDTLLRWHRELIAQKWNNVHQRKPGRPRTKDEIVALILRMAQENSGWGYTRILGALSNVGYKVNRGTVANILALNGIDRAPLRRVLKEFMTHYHEERNHQGLANQIITAAANDEQFAPGRAFARRSRLGGLLNYYHTKAA